MDLFYIWLALIPITGVICSAIISKQPVTRSEDIVGALMASIFWPVALLGIGIGWLAKGLRRLRNRNAK